MKKEIKGEGNYWALLCSCTDGNPLICGVFSTYKEAKEVAENVKDCPSKHKIEKCKVKITLCQKK